MEPPRAPDLGIPDLGIPDLGIPDLGIPDLGIPDLGIPDLGSTAGSQPGQTSSSTSSAPGTLLTGRAGGPT
jgi:hypothetical protein